MKACFEQTTESIRPSVYMELALLNLIFVGTRLASLTMKYWWKYSITSMQGWAKYGRFIMKPAITLKYYLKALLQPNSQASTSYANLRAGVLFKANSWNMSIKMGHRLTKQKINWI